MKNRVRLVVLGAGYGGITLAAHLDNKVSNNDMQIILVNINSYHELIQEAHLVAGGFRNLVDVRIPISDLIKDTNIQFIQSNVKKVRADENKIILENSDEIVYDFLVVALGASTQFFGIKGTKEYALTLRSTDDGLTIHHKISKLIDNEKSNNGISNEKGIKNITIVGGGPTGVGVAGALADLINHNSSSKKAKILIITASPTILPGFDTRTIDEVVRILHRKSISIITNTTASEVRQDSVILGDGLKGARGHIPSSITIWTPGIKGYDLHIEPHIEKTNNGRIVVNDFCQVNDFHNIFCIGDISAMKEPSSSEIKNPPLAHIAISQAIYLAESIAEFFMHKIKPSQEFRSEVNVRILSLGLNDYVGLLNNMLVTGDMARIIKEFKKEAHLESISSGETTIATKIYKNDPVSNLLSSVFVTISSLSKTLRNRVPVPGTMSNEEGHTLTTEKIDDLKDKA